MKIWFSILLLILRISLMANHSYRPNLNKNDDYLNGKVKQVIENVFDWGKLFIAVKNYNPEGMITSIKYYKSKYPFNINQLDTSISNLVSTELYNYGLKNHLILSKYILDSNEELVFSLKNYYDTNDSLIACVIQNYGPGNSALDSTSYCYKSYNDSIVKVSIKAKFDTIEIKSILKSLQGNVSRIVTKQNNDDCIDIQNYSYDEHGNPLSTEDSSVSTEDSSLCNLERNSFVYNSENMVIYKENIKISNSNERRMITMVDYDSAKIMRRELISLYVNQMIESSAEFIMNDHENAITIEMMEYFYDQNNEVKIQQEFIKRDYMYDKNFNWLEMKEFRNDIYDEHASKQRIINYYD